MRIVSIYDLPGGRDRADLIPETIGSGAEDTPHAFAAAAVQFFERGGTTEPRAPESREELLIVMQGAGRIVIDGVEHPVRFGDAVLIEAGDRWQAIADEIDPFVLLMVSARRPA